MNFNIFSKYSSANFKDVAYLPTLQGLNKQKNTKIPSMN